MLVKNICMKKQVLYGFLTKFNITQREFKPFKLGICQIYFNQSKAVSTPQICPTTVAFKFALAIKSYVHSWAHACNRINLCGICYLSFSMGLFRLTQITGQSSKKIENYQYTSYHFPFLFEPDLY